MQAQEDTLKLQMQRMYRDLKLLSDKLHSRPCYQHDEDKVDGQLPTNLTAGRDGGLFGTETMSLASDRNTSQSCNTDSACDDEYDFDRYEPTAYSQADLETDGLECSLEVDETRLLTRNDSTCVRDDCTDQGKTSLLVFYEM